MNQDSKTTLESLENKSSRELRDLLSRQDKILQNRAFVAKLKDQGAKLHSARKKIQAALNEALTKESKNLGSIEPTTRLKSEEFEWTINSMAMMNLNSSGTESQLEDHDLPSTDISTRTRGSVPTTDVRRPLQVSCETEANCIKHEHATSPTKAPHTMIIRCPPDNLVAGRDKFKPSHPLNPVPPTSEKLKTSAQAEKQLRWDEALLPPTSSKTVKQLDWHASFQELCSHKLRQKMDYSGVSGDRKSRSYAFAKLPSSSINLSILTKNVYDLLDDDDDDCGREDLEDHIIEESETEEE